MPFGGGRCVVKYTLVNFCAIVEAWPDVETFRLHNDSARSRLRATAPVFVFSISRGWSSSWAILGATWLAVY